MNIFEMNIDGEVYVGMDEELSYSIDTQLLEANLYGKNSFLRSLYFYHFTTEGPRPITRIEMTELLTNHEED